MLNTLKKFFPDSALVLNAADFDRGMISKKKNTHPKLIEVFTKNFQPDRPNRSRKEGGKLLLFRS